MASKKNHPLQNIHITAEEKPFKVIETQYKYNEQTGKYDSWKIESKKTSTYYAVLWRNLVFVREDGKHEYEALCGISVKKRFGVGTDMEGFEYEVVGFPFTRMLQIEDKYLVIPSRINGRPVTDIQIDNCESSYIICPLNPDKVFLHKKCDHLKKIIGNFKDFYIDGGKNKIQTLKFLHNEGSICSKSSSNGLKEIILSCEDEFGAYQMRSWDSFPMLLDVYSLENTPPEAYNLFEYEDKNGKHCLGNTLKHGILHVPQGSKRYYQVALGWKNFQNIEEFTQEEIDEKLAECKCEDERILDEAYTKLRDELFPKNKTSQPQSQENHNNYDEMFGFLCGDCPLETKSEAQKQHLPIPDCFERKGDFDLLYKLQLNNSIKSYGGKVIVPTITGQIRITIPAGKRTGDILRAKGKGLTNQNSVGDLYIEII